MALYLILGRSTTALCLVQYVFPGVDTIMRSYPYMVRSRHTQGVIIVCLTEKLIQRMLDRPRTSPAEATD